MTYSVVVGNVYDGFTVVGPFDDLEAAGRFANGSRIPEEMIATAMELVHPDHFSVPD